jgi:hypothetical protein
VNQCFAARRGGRGEECTGWCGDIRERLARLLLASNVQ